MNNEKSMIKNYTEHHIRVIFNLLSNKWTLTILMQFDGLNRKITYTELKGLTPGISEKMLTQTLRGLELEQGLLSRKFYYGMPPHSEYWLSEKGARLMPILKELLQWDECNY